MNYMIADLAAIEPTRCPCEWAKRAFGEPGNTTATMHLVKIERDARVHYHKRMTEIYLVLEGEGFMELDGELHPVKPMSTILIKPGCRHRAAASRTAQPLRRSCLEDRTRCRRAAAR